MPGADRWWSLSDASSDDLVKGLREQRATDSVRTLMAHTAPPLLELVAEHLRHRLLATLVAAVGASTAPKIVLAGAGPQHVRLQTALEDFAANNGFREFHDFDELLPDVLAASTVDIFVGEASAAPLLRPGNLDMRQRI